MTRQPTFKITFRYIVKEEPVADLQYPDWATGIPPQPVITTSTGTMNAICPDLLSIRNLGEADGWRGVAVRVFFVALWWVTGV